MPGRRNLQRERSQHDAHARHHAIYSQLRAHVPEHDRALIGHAAILDHLHRLGIRRLNGRQLTWRIVNAWRVHHAAPILKGHKHPRFAGPALTTSHALTSWLLARFTSCDLFNVISAEQLTTTGLLPRVTKRAA